MPTEEAFSAEAWLPFLLQTSDALFPTGAYAHSLGFEEIVRLGKVKDEHSLGVFLMDEIVPAQREQELPYLRFACNAAERQDLAELCVLDREVSAWKLAKETREASVQLGARRLQALRTIHADQMLDRFAGAVGSDEASGHHLIVFGVQSVLGYVPLTVALTSYLYQAMAAVCSAALKLIRIGQDGIQRVLHQTCQHASCAVRASLEVPRETAGWFSPMLEIASMRHLHANERLFIS
jgi:urease accessory protein